MIAEILMPTSPPMQTHTLAVRRCARCGDPNYTTGPICEPCTLNRLALRIMRDPAWPDADARRVQNAREAVDQ